jgi:polyhydroxyalkanoate synthesis regulator phasin
VTHEADATTTTTTTAAAAVTDETLGRRLREAWHKTVGTWATDEKGTQSLVSRLVGFGTLSSDEAKRVLADAKKRVEENKAELDRRVDDSLTKASALFSSEQREVKKLEERIAELEARLKALQA